MPRHFGIALTGKRREQLKAAMVSHGHLETARLIGCSLNTLKSACGGFTIHRGTAAMIEAWLDKNAEKDGGK